MNRHSEFFQFVIPSVAAFALSGVYAIVDGFFVGNSLGDNGLAAINLGFPVAAFMQAAGTGIGLSGAIRFTILRSQKKQNEVRESLFCTCVLLLLASVVLTGLVLAFPEPLLHILGARGELLTLTAQYIRVIAIGSVFQIFSTGLVPFIRNLNGSSFAMYSMIAGFLTNILLDYIFVWKLGLGMSGAAWATVIGQAVTAAATVYYLIREKAGLRIPQKAAALRLFRIILPIAAAPFGLTFSPQITTILMNRYLMVYGGDQAVAVYGCIAYITSITYLLLQGVGDGVQPLISRYYSENRIDYMREMRSYAYRTAFGVSAVCMAGFWLTRNHVGMLFGASAQTSQDVGLILPLFLAALAFLSYIRITTAFLYATEQGALSYILVYGEPFFIFLLLLILPQIPALGLLGVWLAVPLAQFLTWWAALWIRRKADRHI